MGERPAPAILTGHYGAQTPRGSELPRTRLLETVWKIGWRGVNEARSLACNAKIRSPRPSMSACEPRFGARRDFPRQSLEKLSEKSLEGSRASVLVAPKAAKRRFWLRFDHTWASRVELIRNFQTVSLGAWVNSRFPRLAGSFTEWQYRGNEGERSRLRLGVEVGTCRRRLLRTHTY